MWSDKLCALYCVQCWVCIETEELWEEGGVDYLYD